MPRKPIPASEPLASELQERLDAFKKYSAEHAMLSRKDDAVTQAVWEPGGFAFLLLSGPTGVGKSELLRGVTHRMHSRAQVLIPGDRLPLPVILVETPAPLTYREWYELVEARLAEMATDIVAGEQLVELTGGSREQLHSLLLMETKATPIPTNSVETSSARPRRTSTRPGTRKPKRDSVGE